MPSRWVIFLRMLTTIRPKRIRLLEDASRNSNSYSITLLWSNRKMDRRTSFPSELMSPSRRKALIRDLPYGRAKEANPRAGKISHESPIGMALMDHRVGDVIDIETPGGKIKLRILKIE